MPLPARFMTATALFLSITPVALAQVPGYVPPVSQTQAPDYADDTRGVYVPSHMQPRLQTEGEMQNYAQQRMAQATGAEDEFEREMNRIAAGDSGWGAPVTGGGMQQQAQGQYQGQQYQGQQQYQGEQGYTMGQMPSLAQGGQSMARPMQPAQPNRQNYQGQTMPNSPYSLSPSPYGGQQQGGQGVEMAKSQLQNPGLDAQNTIVRLREDRISIRRVLQRMMDQAGASDWTIMWDLSEQNRALPDMEISIDAHEPLINVLNALLTRMQTRSGMPLKAVRYDNARRLVITDRVTGGSDSQAVSPIGVDTEKDPVVTERVLKESMVSLHYDEIPLVDALESIVNQAGKGEWRLRIYSGMDQVLKPAHIEEPFGIAMERLLKLFNLKYEIFPGGKLVVVTHNNRFGFSTGMNN